VNHLAKRPHVFGDPERAGEVRLRVDALGLNRAEVMFRQGRYIEQPDLPSVLGYEASGVVEAVGEGVVKPQVGERVSTVPSFSMRRYGVYGETAVVPAYAAVRYPPNLSPVEGAAIWMQYLTPYFALHDLGHLPAGQHVLITAVSSSVGIATIQLAKAMGAIAIATTRRVDNQRGPVDAGASIVYCMAASICQALRPGRKP
jgi:NADPH:quinone reductase